MEEVYKEKIIKLINNLKDLETLEYLYTFIELVIKKWGN